ncbi:hypothetical protein ACFP3U_15855 [Kitasatospora misakiensis]|uniref:DUF397 domain-containing protein n=1 Tax=Kitasatospora misakiensis TaxID=67330 RepID=A0ABW0X5P3_9ACTN
MSKYTILPIADPAGTGSPCWVMKNNEKDELVKAPPPDAAPLRFYSFNSTLDWARKSNTGQEAA